MNTQPADATQPLCDLVMKGGITSGVVYPTLIAQLARVYRFKNIGGTSAGAIAAAGCAAAEHGRLSGQNPEGFSQLERLPDELKQRQGDGHSMLFHLFQPAEPVRKHFAVLVSMLNASPLDAAGRALLAMVLQFWGFTLIGLVLALLLFTPVVAMAAPGRPLLASIGVALAIVLLWWLWAAYGLRRLHRLKASAWRPLAVWWVMGLLATAVILRLIAGAGSGPTLWSAVVAGGIAAPLTIGVVLLLSGWRFGATLVAGMHGNGYGLCSGRTVAPSATSGLTDWLDSYLRQLAGHPHVRPLVFGDIWGAAFHDGRFDEPAPQERRINLEVMTSAVSRNMCHAIPFREPPQLYYDPQEWSAIFPTSVMDWLLAVSGLEAAARAGHGEAVEPVVYRRPGHRQPLKLLPSNANLPLVVAVRMSLSFPGLLSAVPLYAVDTSRRFNQRATRRELRATRVWFSDGGIGSNLPLHFFDSPLPTHPTFAVNLKDRHPDYRIDTRQPADRQLGRVYLPTNNQGGQQRYWSAPPDHAGPAAGLVAFLWSIVHTMQNWRDELQFPYPGYRDRIVQISQLADEGGLNLDMLEASVEQLSGAGRVAAAKLVARFHSTNGHLSEGWRNHRQQRLRILLGVLERMGQDVGAAMVSDGWDRVLEDMPPSAYSGADKALAVEYLKAMQVLAQLEQDSPRSLWNKAPRPRASLHISPRV